MECSAPILGVPVKINLDTEPALAQFDLLAPVQEDECYVCCSEIIPLDQHSRLIKWCLYPRAGRALRLAGPPVGRRAALAHQLDRRGPGAAQLRFQLRCATSREELKTARWQGPEGERSFYETSGVEIRGLSPAARWLQYQALFMSPDGCASPRLREVRIEFGPTGRRCCSSHILDGPSLPSPVVPDHGAGTIPDRDSYSICHKRSP